MSILDSLNRKTEEMTLAEYLKLAKKDKSMYASPAERMLKAIGDPVMLDTAKDPKLARVFGNKVIKQYPAFSDFYGMEEIIERLVSFFKHASQGLEEKKQILYLLGPVGSAKSSLAERLKELMEKVPFYAIKGSPILDNPLSLFSASDSEELGIPAIYLTGKASPWLVKRLEEWSEEVNGDVDKLFKLIKVVKLYPDQNRQVGITKTEPGDENNQDISALVGKLDIRKLEFFAQDDPDAYRYNGGLCLGNRGILEFVEMFKAPIKVLHPLLTATQEGNYKGTEALPAIPFDGIILAHSNESEWQTFRNNKNNEAFLDRVYVVKVPYNLRYNEEINIYKKLIKHSGLVSAPLSPHTLDIVAQFVVLSRLEKPENSDVWLKLKTYDGQYMKEQYSKAKSYQEYKDTASLQEGFSGISTRTAYKLLAEAYNHDSEEIGANPVHMLYVIEKMISKDDAAEDKKNLYRAYLNDQIKQEYADILEKTIHKAYFENYADYGQHVFDKYIYYADAWLQDRDFRDEDTGEMFDRELLNKELSAIETPAGVSNPKDFRNEVVHFCLRQQAKNGGKNPSWTSYEKMKDVIEKNMFSTIETILPVIAFNKKANEEESKKHKKFVEAMMKDGRTEKQVRLEVDWYLRFKKRDNN